MLKNKVESLLFSSGRKMTIEEISRLSHAKPEDIKNALAELKLEYDDRGSSVMVVNEGDSWKLTTREQYLPLVQKIVTETELTKTIMETLAVIAFKYPIKQSALIKIRTNKAYDHLKELEEMGYISRVKYGRTKLIKLTQKFFEYFNLPEEKLKDQFKDFASIANAIETKEKEIETIKQEQRAEAEKEKQKDEDIKKEIESVDKEEQPEFEGAGIKVTKEMEKEIDEEVDKMMHPPKEEQEKPKTEEKKEEKESKPKEEPKDLLEAEMEEKDKEKK